MGHDKALLETPAGPAWALLGRTLAGAAGSLVISTRAGSPVTHGPWPVVLDECPGAGPLAALQGAVAQLDAVDVVVVSAVDVVLLDAATIEVLLEQLEDGGGDACVAVDPQAGLAVQLFVARAQPLARAIRDAMEAGQRSLRSALSRLDLVRLSPADLPDPRVLAPCNTPEQWRDMQRLVAQRHATG